jgi:flavin reductase (DIM6/NTAB) family NADH-FMN oxidoreductase RutF
MLIDVAQTDPLAVYRTLIGVVTPRPIAWVTSIDEQGRVNLAPFSFFNAFGSNPPVVVFSPGLRRDGTKKDTLRNVEVIPECVIHAATAEMAAAVNLSSSELPYGQSEVDLTGLSLTPSLRVRPPRLVEAQVSMECAVRQIVPLGSAPGAGNLVIAEVLVLHVADGVLDAAGRIDPRKLRTIGRLGGDWYCHTSDLFEMKRP